MKNYYCDVDLKFSGNNFEASSKDEYIKKLKQSFLEEFGISLQDYEIKNIESEE